MKLVAKSRIFLADQRRMKETHSLRRFSTFNFGQFSNPDKGPIDELYIWNEDLLAARQKTGLVVDRDIYILIVPITGSVNYLDDAENETDVKVEEVAVTYVERGTNITLSNSYDNDTVHYLCIGVMANKPMPNNPQFFSFDLSDQNKLIKISHNFLPFSLSIGRFNGRREAVFQLSPHHKLFAFVISGAFEIEGRLLHEKDGIALWQTPDIEMEALSNEAVIVMVELNLMMAEC